jgi:hypothetical protein
MNLALARASAKYYRTSMPILRLVSLLHPSLFRDYGRAYSVLCPFHGDTDPSFRVDPDKNRLICYGACGKSWDPVGYVQHSLGLNFIKAVKFLDQLSDPAEDSLTRMYSLSNSSRYGYNLLEKLEGTTFDLAKDYLISRGLSDGVISPNQVLGTRESVFFLQNTKLGLPNTLIERRLRLQPKYLIHTSLLWETPFGYLDVRDYSHLFLCEAPIDALSLRTCVSVNAVSIRLASLDYYLRDLRFSAWFSRFKVIFLMFDGDEAGRSASAKFITRFKNSSIVSLPDTKDVNDLLMEGILHRIIKFHLETNYA